MAQQFVQSRIKGDKVVLFVKPTCSFCHTAQKVLSGYKFKPGRLDCVDIGGRSDTGAIQDYFQELTGARTVIRGPAGDGGGKGQRSNSAVNGSDV